MNANKPSKEFWSTKRVLVTGATGMVGAWVTRWLVDAGALAARLGPGILRTSTAGAVASGILLARTARWDS